MSFNNQAPILIKVSNHDFLNILDYGVSPNKSGVENKNAFQQVIDTAITNGKKVYVPDLNGNTIVIEGTLRVAGDKGIEIYGNGFGSALKATTKPHPLFIVTAPNTRIHDLHIQGDGVRDLTGYDKWVMDTREAHLYCGVLLHAGSDGSQVYNMYGSGIHILVNSNAYSEAVDGYAGTNIKNITISNLVVDNVWAAVHLREIDNLVVENVKGNYSPDVGYGGPPHLVYVAYVGTEDIEFRPNHNVTLSNLQAYNGVGGTAFAIKGIHGGSATGLVADNCEGFCDYEMLEDFEITAPISVNDRSLHSDRTGSHRITMSKRVTINGGYTRFARGNHSSAVATTNSTEDCLIIHRAYSNHDTENLDRNKADFNCQGTRNEFRISTECLGERIGSGAKVLNSNRIRVTNPSVKNYKFGILFDDTSQDSELYYDPYMIDLADVTGALKINARPEATFFNNPSI